MSKFFITCGDTDFQQTLTEREKGYIHGGQNWISKFSRETDLKSIHSLGWTLDEVEELPEDEQNRLWEDATECWNSQDWSGSAYRREQAVPQKMGRLDISKR
jgi:hypothetical protein